MTDVARKKQSRLCVCVILKWDVFVHVGQAVSIGTPQPFPVLPLTCFRRKPMEINRTGRNSFYMPSFLTEWLGS